MSKPLQALALFSLLQLTSCETRYKDRELSNQNLQIVQDSIAVVKNLQEEKRLLEVALLNTKRVYKKELFTLLDNLCQDSAQSFEVADLYEDVNEMPAAHEDRLILDDMMLMRGFTPIPLGYGNWSKGPRMVNMELESAECRCLLDKLYYSPAVSSGKYKITERITCIKKRKPF